MADWKNKLKAIQIENPKKIVLEKTIKEENSTRIQSDSYYNLANVIDRLIKKISIEKQKSFKEKNVTLIKNLEKELIIKRAENIHLIAKLRRHYPNLSASEIGEKQHILESEIADKIAQFEENKIAKQKAEVLKRKEDALKLKIIEEEKNRLKQELIQKKANELVSIFKITKCKKCDDGFQSIICSICNGTLQCPPRDIVISQRFICSNTSPKCPTCFGTGIGSLEKKVVTTRCACLTGKENIICKTCEGTRLEVSNHLQENFLDQVRGDLELVDAIKKLIKFRN